MLAHMDNLLHVRLTYQRKQEYEFACLIAVPVAYFPSKLDGLNFC
jgi:hypothetical protein